MLCIHKYLVMSVNVCCDTVNSLWVSHCRDGETNRGSSWAWISNMSERLDMKYYIITTVHPVKHHNSLLSFLQEFLTPRGFLMGHRAQTSSVVWKWFFNLRKWKVMENHSALYAGHKQNLTKKVFPLFRKERMTCCLCIPSSSRLMSTSISKKPPPLKSGVPNV